MSEQYEIWKNTARDLKWALRLFIEDEMGYAPHSAKSDALIDYYMDKAKQTFDSFATNENPKTVKEECTRMVGVENVPEPTYGVEYVRSMEDALVYYNLTTSLLNLYRGGIITKEEFREMLGLSKAATP